MAAPKRLIAFPQPLIDQIDAARGDVTFQTWVRKAAELRIEGEVPGKAASPLPRAGSRPPARGAGGRNISDHPPATSPPARRASPPPAVTGGPRRGGPVPKPGKAGK